MIWVSGLGEGSDRLVVEGMARRSGFLLRIRNYFARLAKVKIFLKFFILVFAG